MKPIPPNARTLMAAALVLLAGMVAATLPTRSQVRQADENSLKAAFIYNFMIFSEWPSGAFADASSPIQLCVLGDTPVSDPLISLQDKTVQNHPIKLRQVAAPADASTCHALYVGDVDPDTRKAVMRDIATKSVLTISSEAGFGEDGGMITFAVVNSRVTFQINIDAVKRSGLHLSSKLLSLATNVR